MKRKSLSKKLVFLVVMATTMSNFTAYAGEMHKDETVYVILDENGKPTSNIVSDKISSDEVLGEFEDKSSLSNIKNVKSKNYFALFEENENTAEVFYFEFEKNNLKNMINDILQNTDAEYFRFTHNKIFENAQKIRYGMVKSLDSKITVPKDIYIGITLN